MKADLKYLRACRGAEAASAVLVTREVEGLERRTRSIADWGTAPRPRQTRSADQPWVLLLGMRWNHWPQMPGCG